MTPIKGTLEDFWSTVELCGKLVEGTIGEKYTTVQFVQQLRNIGISAPEAHDYLEKLRQHTHPSSDNCQPSGPLSVLLKPKALAPSDASASSIPSSVLAVAPHLASLSQGTDLDDHLLKTWKLRKAYSTKKAINPIIDLMQCQRLPDLIPRSIWRKIIQDEFIDFERLYGSM